ncbi:trans-2,3-dihydro-3-hydroxyanthranilate isomerase [Rhodoblastus acidophilus]|uniref:PhzF family phenazine biosynthesis protein n=1 Tax=Rhodoblastus acidophilus TaxID=1074 RepID=UPI002225A3FB|nr:PhzF family phenazine biosynthesis protein [Rhodoblastus acidophilus]MCW2282459.1 trans-2,3-dihydro-3-hydroxyanthranilate isomerase [Rhodoblastus acidophilus]MCW2331136.1 trans-2,3-dihydro-3-hydroxyanthranilate isomerase [Rhodoblastus acidophilus]
MKLPYRRLDVFTERPLAGNPLAVVLDADELDGARMHAIAREFNLSETVFVLRARDPINTARLRIFTPAVELPFAGHPTIGAAALIAFERARDMLGQAPIRLVLEEDVGPVVCEVARVRGALRAEFVVPHLPEIFAETLDVSRIAAALGFTEDDIGFDAHKPVIASAGLPFAFIPVASRVVLNRAKPDFSALGATLPMERPAVCLYTRETQDGAHHVQARVFVPGLGVAEDPATGSAAAAFAAVAAKFENPEDGEHMLHIEQGVAMGRPSLITLSMRVDKSALTHVAIAGASVIVGEGFFRL